MFCPRCRAEYREGFTVCADCRIPLVDVLPVADEPVHPDVNFVKLLETNDPTDVAQIRAVLDAEKIDYYIQGEVTQLMIPYTQPAVLIVPEGEAERAREALKDVQLNYLRMFFKPT